MLPSNKMPSAVPKIIVNPHDDILKYAKQQNAIRKERESLGESLRDRATRVAHMLGKKAGRRTRRMRRSRRRTLRKM
jgi:hypothetical protein